MMMWVRTKPFLLSVDKVQKGMIIMKKLEQCQKCGEMKVLAPWFGARICNNCFHYITKDKSKLTKEERKRMLEILLYAEHQDF